jgi:hypothetical protein
MLSMEAAVLMDVSSRRWAVLPVKAAVIDQRLRLQPALQATVLSMEGPTPSQSAFASPPTHSRDSDYLPTPAHGCSAPPSYYGSGDATL